MKIIYSCILLCSIGLSAQSLKNNNSNLILDSNKEITPDKPVALGEVTYEMLSSLKDVKEDDTTTTKKPPLTKLIKKANRYFKKMWYAEAAILYEKALNKNKKNYSRHILQKAGDSYYFNTNMKKAYHWYNILYNIYKRDMSTDNLFKYAHSLKGVGKYSKAKKIVKLYNRKIKEKIKERIKKEGDTILDTKQTPNEILLDNILSKKQRFKIKNLSVNSEYSDFSPMFHGKDKIVFASTKDSLYFNTRLYKWNNQPYSDLYVSKINEDSQELNSAVKFSKKISTKYHEASVAFSLDSSMYFSANNYSKKLKRGRNGTNNLKIYRSKKADGEWSKGIELPFSSNEYSIGHPALSPDGKQLYFVSDMPQSIGKTDIFVVDVLGGNTFSEPRNLGPDINTEGREMFPFISAKKLYFSSDGHIGLGGLDVYEVPYDDEGFKEVKNVGQAVNSNKDDFSYIVDEESQKGYFTSNRAGGKGSDDIYSFKRLIVEEVEENLNAINGVVTDLITSEMMPNAGVILLDKNNVKLKEVTANDDGSFVFKDLENNTKYIVRVVVEGYFDEEMIVNTKENEVVDLSVKMKKLKELKELIVVENGIMKFKTDMIYFNFDKFNIRTDATNELDKIVEVMTAYPNMVIKIESHTDARGKRAYNKHLSDKRAKATKNYLIEHGIDGNRIESAIGYGEEELLNECGDGIGCSEGKHQLNRRSEFIIVKGP